MRTTWNGFLSFGLVNIPVGLAPATAPSARQSDVQFRMLHRECLTPIKQKRWCPVHNVEVGSEDLVRGWEITKGEFIPVEDAELEAIEQRDTSRAIAITSFVKLDQVDPVDFDRTYFLVPSTAEAQRNPYALLRTAMVKEGVGAVGSFVLAGKEKLCLIRTKGDALALETLFLAEDVKGQTEIDDAVKDVKVRAPELKLATQIIASLEAPFDPAALKSEYRAQLRELLKAKSEGHEIPEPPAETVAWMPEVDLMEALRASIGGKHEAEGECQGGDGVEITQTRFDKELALIELLSGTSAKPVLIAAPASP